jgi:hypothetical protein
MSLQNSTARRQGDESPTNADPVTAGSTLIPAQVLTLTRRVKALVDKGDRAALDQPAEEIVDEVDCRVSCAIAALDLAGRSESGLSGKEADEQRDNLVRVVRLLQTTPSLPANSNRARALRRIYDTIAALDLAGRSESGLSGKEADELRDNLVQAVRLLHSGAR